MIPELAEARTPAAAGAAGPRRPPDTGGIDGAVEDRALIPELVEGPTLAERIQQGAMPMEEAAHRAADRRGAGVRARKRHRPPRPQARQHQGHAAARFCPRQSAVPSFERRPVDTPKSDSVGTITSRAPPFSSLHVMPRSGFGASAS